MAMKTQGSELYFIYKGGSAPKLMKVGYVTSVSDINGGEDSPIEIIHLDDNAYTYLAGVNKPSAMSVEYNFNTQDESHHALQDTKEKGLVSAFVFGFSDGKSAPTLNGDADGFELPSDRSWVSFNATIASNPISASVSDVMKGSLSLQVSGAPKFKYKGV